MKIELPKYFSNVSILVFSWTQNGTGDANDVWRVEVVGGREGDKVQTVTTKIKFHHYFMKCVLTSSG